MLKHLGTPPREFTDDLLYVIGKNTLPLFCKDKLKEKLINAHIVKSAVVQADLSAFEKNSEIANAVFLYTFDKDLYRNEEKLLEIVDCLKNLKLKVDLSDEEINVTNLLLNENSYFYHIPVPKSLTDGKEYFITRGLLKKHFFIDQQLPERLLIDAIVMCNKNPKLSPEFSQVNMYKYNSLKS